MSTPVNISRSPSTPPPTDNAGAIPQSLGSASTARAVPGTPRGGLLSRGQYPAGTGSFTGTPSTPVPVPPIANIPPRAGTPRPAGTPQYYGSPSGHILGRASPAGLGTRTPIGQPTSGSVPISGPLHVDFEDIPDEAKARVLRRHLVSRQERQNRIDRRSPAGSDDEVGSMHSTPASQRPAREDSEPFPIPYDAPGGDITHPIYKWQSQHRIATDRRQRAVSLSLPAVTRSDPAFEHIHEPNGFRRNYLLMQRSQEENAETPAMVNNFIEFLYLFGHFAGEDLEDDEGESDDLEEPLQDDEAEPSSSTQVHVHQTAQGALQRVKISEYAKDIEASETAPLISRSRLSRSLTRRSRSRRRSSIGPHGDASVTQAVLMLLKAFVGTGVLFLGKAFANGGILFSSFLLVFIALVSLYSFLLLVKAKFAVPGSFGDIGGTLYGPWMRYAILSSITVSQLGFVSAYTIFIAQNLQAFIAAVTDCLQVVPVSYLILSQIVVLLPFALIRNIAKLGTAAIIADVFILLGLVYIFGSEISLVRERGWADVVLFNSKDFPLLVGTAVFSFEGIGLVIPITDAMREPRKFPAVLTGVMLFLAVLFGGAGALAYGTFGKDIQTVVIVNLDSTSRLVQIVQFIYSIAILLSTPLQLFPAVRIMENGLFSSSGKADWYVKWQKNMFRFSTVIFCMGVSWWGAADLDKFVSLVGSFACVPLCYVYPAMLHYKACARTRKEKIADVVLIVFGMVACAYTTVQTIHLMMAPSESPKFGKC